MHLSPQELMGWDEPTETKTIAAHFNGDEYTESSFGILYKDLLIKSVSYYE